MVNPYTAEKDLGVAVDHNLRFHQHAAAAATKSQSVFWELSISAF